MQDFVDLPVAGRMTLANVTVPGWTVGQAAELVGTDITIEGDRIVDSGEGERVEMAGAMVLPCFTDMHTHIDKGHIWQRSPNPNGTFDGALATVQADREARWSAEDVRRRMDFSLRCAFAHGTRSLRTHIDSRPPQHAISWPALAEMREAWAGRIELQGSSLMAIDEVNEAGGFFDVAAIVAEHGGRLGCVTWGGEETCAKGLDTFFKEAMRRDLEIDFHVDENGDAHSQSLRLIAEKVIETSFDKPVVVGHCCSLAVQDEATAMATLDKVAEAGLHMVSLPMCNMYLQDRAAGRTPRWRGVMPAQEAKARGINVSFASDNTRDPFYAYGDLDMLEVMREATRIAHLDHGDPEWSRAFSANPARACGLDAPGLLSGAPADLVICKARSWTELFARPQADRVVLRRGLPIDRRLPDYAELDDLMEGK